MNSLAKLATEVEEDLLVYFRRRLKNDVQAQEYKQETLLRFTKGGYNPLSSDARAILFGIARHLIADYLRQLRKDQALGLWDSNIGQDALDDVASHEPTPDRVAQSQQELARVMSVIDTLPKRPRQVFFLCRMRGMTHRQIADQLGISKSMVEKHMMDATARLLRGLKKT